MNSTTYKDLKKNLICLCGLPRTGKSTIAKSINRSKDICVISTDQIRKNRNVAPDNVLMTTRVYEWADKIASLELHKGNSVVIDACCALKFYRNLFLITAKKHKDVITWLIILRMKTELIKRRVSNIQSKIQSLETPILGVNDIKAINKIADSFEWPDSEEKNHWDIVIELKWGKGTWELFDYSSKLNIDLYMTLKLWKVIS